VTNECHGGAFRVRACWPERATTVPKQKLLLIDDSSMIAAATRLLLRGTEIELSAAQSGEEGIAQAELLKPDLILLDVHMPGIDGFETCRRMRAEPWGSLVPIVMASADIGEREREQGTSAGCTDFMKKPFDKQGLIALIGRYLGRSGAAA
jgi:CheY-like chemotaxis protein